MTAGNGLPCERCGASDWYNSGHCKICKREQASQWHKANPDKTTKANQRWGKANPSRIAGYKRRWREANLERVTEVGRQWQRNNPDKGAAKNSRRRTRKAQAGGSYTAAEWRDLCSHYGNICLRCKRDNVKLTPDHILPVVKGGSSNIDNIQPLCKSCNSAKKDRHIDYRPDAGPLRWLQAKLFG